MQVPLVDRVRRRLAGDYVVDEWGYDHDLVEVLAPVLGLRWRVEVVGSGFLPDGPGVLVANRRLGLVEPLVLALGVRQATGRSLRFLGIPDVAPIGPALRRVGGAVAHPGELGSLLRAGHLCALPLGRVLRSRGRAGAVTPESLAPALTLNAPVVPVALVGSEITGRWRAYVGEPVAQPDAEGPLALAEVAEEAAGAVQALLDEAFPPRWLLG